MNQPTTRLAEHESATPTQPETPGVARSIVVFATAVAVIDAALIAGLAPLLPGLSERLGLSSAGSGVLTAAYPAGMLLATVAAGAIATVFGPLRCAVIGLVVVSFSSVAFALGDVAWILTLARFAQGIGGALAWTGALGLLLAEAPVNRRGETIGRVFGFSFMGTISGPGLGAVAETVGRPMIFVPLGLAMLGLAVYGSRLGTPYVRSSIRLGDLRRLSGTGAVLALVLIIVLGFVQGTLQNVGALRLSTLGMGAAAIAASFMFGYAVQLVLAPVLGRLADRGNPFVPPAFGAGITAVLLAVLAITGEPVVALLALAAGWTACLSMWGPAGVILTSGAERARVSQMVAMAAMSGAWGLGLSFGATGAGVVARETTDGLALALPSLLCVGLVLLLASRGARVTRHAAVGP